MTLIPFPISEARRLIVEFLVGSALADHLGDIRDDEDLLYLAIGFTKDQLKSEDLWEYEHPLDKLKFLLKSAGLESLAPEYIFEDDDE